MDASWEITDRQTWYKLDITNAASGACDINGVTTDTANGCGLIFDIANEIDLTFNFYDTSNILVASEVITLSGTVTDYLEYTGASSATCSGTGSCPFVVMDGYIREDADASVLTGYSRWMNSVTVDGDEFVAVSELFDDAVEARNGVRFFSNTFRMFTLVEGYTWRIDYTDDPTNLEVNFNSWDTTDTHTHTISPNEPEFCTATDGGGNIIFTAGCDSTTEPRNTNGLKIETYVSGTLASGGQTPTAQGFNIWGPYVRQISVDPTVSATFANVNRADSCDVVDI